MKIKLDENMPADLGTVLRDAGHDVHSAVEEGLAGQADARVLEVAQEEGRILMSYDTDFADVRRYPPDSHAGIVVFRLRDQRWKALEAPVTRLLTEGALDKLERGLAIVTETRVRFRRPRKTRAP